jgi:hypothetical protein
MKKLKNKFTVNDTSDNFFDNGEKLPFLLMPYGTLTMKYDSFWNLCRELLIATNIETNIFRCYIYI